MNLVVVHACFFVLMICQSNLLVAKIGNYKLCVTYKSYLLQEEIHWFQLIIILIVLTNLSHNSCTFVVLPLLSKC